MVDMGYEKGKGGEEEEGKRRKREGEWGGEGEMVPHISAKSDTYVPLGRLR